MARYLIFAATYQMATRYAREHSYNPTECIFVNSHEQVAGLQPGKFSVALVEGWRENPAVVEAYDAWQVRIRKQGASKHARG